MRIIGGVVGNFDLLGGNAVYESASTVLHFHLFPLTLHHIRSHACTHVCLISFFLYFIIELASVWKGRE